MTKIAIPSMGRGGINDYLNPRFGRADNFTFVTIENGEIVEVISKPNPASTSYGSAGIQASQIMGNEGVDVVIAAFLGPNAFNSLNALGIKIYRAPQEEGITIKELINLFLEGKLQALSNANVSQHFGMGGGMGRGMGRGLGGGGMGRGMGRGMGGGRRF
ncbi:MAG: NifB/NifX family molybdenum-iron cluster-binding protein [Promethearchaeota archaeon]